MGLLCGKNELMYVKYLELFLELRKYWKIVGCDDVWEL